MHALTSTGPPPPLGTAVDVSKTRSVLGSMMDVPAAIAAASRAAPPSTASRLSRGMPRNPGDGGRGRDCRSTPSASSRSGACVWTCLARSGSRAASTVTAAPLRASWRCGCSLEVSRRSTWTTEGSATATSSGSKARPERCAARTAGAAHLAWHSPHAASPHLHIRCMTTPSARASKRSAWRRGLPRRTLALARY